MSLLHARGAAAICSTAAAISRDAGAHVVDRPPIALERRARLLDGGGAVLGVLRARLDDARRRGRSRSGSRSTSSAIWPAALLGLLGELAHLLGDDREAAALLAGAGGLDRGVERQQVRLLGDAGDRVDDAADLLGHRRRARSIALGDGRRTRARRASPRSPRHGASAPSCGDGARLLGGVGGRPARRGAVAAWRAATSLGRRRARLGDRAPGARRPARPRRRRGDLADRAAGLLASRRHLLRTPATTSRAGGDLARSSRRVCSRMRL